MAENIGAKMLRDPMWRLLLILITCTLSSCFGFIDFRIHWLDSYWIAFNSVILVFFPLGSLDFPKKNLQISGLEIINWAVSSLVANLGKIIEVLAFSVETFTYAHWTQLFSVWYPHSQLDQMLSSPGILCFPFRATLSSVVAASHM